MKQGLGGSYPIPVDLHPSLAVDVDPGRIREAERGVTARPLVKAAPRAPGREAGRNRAAAGGAERSHGNRPTPPYLESRTSRSGSIRSRRRFSTREWIWQTRDSESPSTSPISRMVICS